MRQLSVNLKHLYQNRSYWLIGLIYAFLTYVFIIAIVKGATGNNQGFFSVPVIWMFFASLFIASLSVEVLTKPFSFCLPGHNKIPRKLLFVIGLALSFLWSLVFLFYPGLSIINTIGACVSAFFTFSVFYWLGVWLVFKSRNWFAVFGIIPLIMLGNQLLNLGSFTVITIVESPLPMILSGCLVNYLAWSYLGRADLARRYCGRLWMGAFDAWNKEKMSELRQVKLAEKEKKKPGAFRMSSNVERFFVSRIERAEAGSLPRYIWGAVYKSFGVMISQQRQDWWRFLMFMLPILIILCYAPGGGKNILFFMPGIMAVQMSLWVRSSFLISGGRGERFWSALTLALVTGVFITAAAAMLGFFTNLLEGIMPDLTIKGYDFVYKGLNMYLIPVPFALVPISLTIGLIFYRKPVLSLIIVMVIFQVFFGLAIIGDLTIMNVKLQIGFRHLIGIPIFNWAVFAAVLRYISMRCCLVSQSG